MLSVERAESPEGDEDETFVLASPDTNSASRSGGLTVQGSQPPSPRTPVRSGTAPRASTPESASAVFAHKRELEELRIKIRLLESHRAEDHATIKSLEKRAAEGDQLPAIRAKLQGESATVPCHADSQPSSRSRLP